MSLCPKNCEYSNYNNKSKKVSCECDMLQTKSSGLLLEDIVNKDKLINNFINIKKISNIGIMKCYKEVLSKNGLINNIGNYILLIIFFNFVIGCIIFYLIEYKILFNEIKNIISQNTTFIYKTKNNNNNKNKKNNNNIKKNINYKKKKGLRIL